MRCKHLARAVFMLAGVLGLASAQSPSADALRLEAAKEYVTVFRDNGLVPILLPRGHAPGDVVAASGEILSRRSDCFAELDLRDEPSRLPNVELSWSAAARFTLAADQLAEAAARGNAEHIVKVRFEGVRAVNVSRQQLQAQVRAAACPDLARALRDNVIPAKDWLLIGEVLVATPVVDVRRAKAGGASLSFLSGLAQRFGFSARTEGGADLTRAEVAELRSEKPVPIAFRPSMVAVTPELAQRYRAAKSDHPALEPFNPQDEAHRAALDDWAARQAAEMR
jgi:hypothetical protein